MNRLPVRIAAFVGAITACGALGTACGGSGEDSAAAGATSLSFRITDEGCDPHDAEAPAGPITFEAEGASSSVTELEVLDGETILGEKENLVEGLPGSFSLTLEEGEYTIRCNGGRQEDGTLTVTGKLETKDSPAVARAIAAYRGYLEQNTAELTAATRPFVAAVLAGDLARARSLYAAARIPYERIEPVAESFGDLDPRIDARENDVEAGTAWTGWHRIEKALWADRSLAGMVPVADQLLADTQDLVERIEGVTLTADQVTNGAKELLDEVATGKVTGEEEFWSHTDLWDFQANVDGARLAYQALRPIVLIKDKDLAATLDEEFASLQTELDKYKTADGFQYYTQLTPEQVKELSDSVNALGEPLSQLTAVVVL